MARVWPDNPEARLGWRGGRVVGRPDTQPDEETDGGRKQRPARDFYQSILGTLSFDKAKINCKFTLVLVTTPSGQVVTTSGPHVQSS